LRRSEPGLGTVASTGLISGDSCALAIIGDAEPIEWRFDSSSA